MKRTKLDAQRGAVGRPPAHRAGEVDARILDTAGELFLARGFDGTSCEQVAAKAGCGKASIYARYADKSELFAATVRHEITKRAWEVAEPSPRLSLARRLTHVATAVLEQSLQPEAIQLKRLLIAEATRFPVLVTEVEGLDRERTTAPIAAVLAAGKTDARTAERATRAAARLIDVAFAPILLRALLGEPLPAGRAAIASSVEDAVAMLGSGGMLEIR